MGVYALVCPAMLEGGWWWKGGGLGDIYAGWEWRVRGIWFALQGGWWGIFLGSPCRAVLALKHVIIIHLPTDANKLYTQTLFNVIIYIFV